MRDVVLTNNLAFWLTLINFWYNIREQSEFSFVFWNFPAFFVLTGDRPSGWCRGTATPLTRSTVNFKIKKAGKFKIQRTWARFARMSWLNLKYFCYSRLIICVFSFQSLESELVCSTAYLELFIRKITEPRLLAVFLQFLFTESHDGKVIIDILVTRLALQSQVRNIKNKFWAKRLKSFFFSL